MNNRGLRRESVVETKRVMREVLTVPVSMSGDRIIHIWLEGDLGWTPDDFDALKTFLPLLDHSDRSRCSDNTDDECGWWKDEFRTAQRPRRTFAALHPADGE